MSARTKPSSAADQEADELLIVDEKDLVQPFKLHLNAAKSDFEAQQTWASEQRVLPCDACKTQSSSRSCVPEGNGIRCERCMNQHQRCSWTRQYQTEYAAAKMGLAMEKAFLLFDKYGTYKKKPKGNTMGKRTPPSEQETPMPDNISAIDSVKQEHFERDLGSEGLQYPNLIRQPPQSTPPPTTFSNLKASRPLTKRSSLSVVSSSTISEDVAGTNIEADLVQHVSPFQMLPVTDEGEKANAENKTVPATTAGGEPASAASEHHTTSAKRAHISSVGEYREEIRTLKFENQGLRMQSVGYQKDIQDLKDERDRLLTENDRILHRLEQNSAVLRFLRARERSHMRLTARISQVELLLRTTGRNRGREARAEYHGRQTRISRRRLLRLAKTELSACLAEDMSSRLAFPNLWNPFQGAAMAIEAGDVLMGDDSLSA